ncbi:MAG: ABC-2 family transporter protein [Anaerolineales bacterium]|nr:ABC-2 family transporter protein [Anaerolineales bacterium]MCB9146974.1 ABC-2 family transporter protein [Anaerolineales bacterium]
MTRYLDLYWLFLIQRLKTLMEYRASFILGAASTISLQAASIAAVWVVMQKVPSLNGWSYNEVLMVYGFVTLTKSINHMFADNLWTIGRVYIRTGGFDRFLVRPIDPLFHLLADRFCQDGVGNFVVGIALVIKTSIDLGIEWTLPKALMLIVATISGGVIFIALNLITAVSSFWVIDSVPVTRLVFDNHLFAQYPLTIYPRAISVLLTWVIPYGFASFYPASYLLGREIGNLAWLSPFIAAFLMFIGYRFWQFGLRYYSGTGS